MTSLAYDYAERMKCHPFGFPLYHPESSHILRPGAVGFFNGLGIWTPVAHLEDSDSLTKFNLRFPTHSLTAAPTKTINEWTPKVSTGVNGKSGVVSLGASGAASGLPVDAHVRFEFSNSTDGGAVLITSSPVTRQGYYYQTPFLEWVKANAKALVDGPLANDINEHGLFVVIQTYTTEKVALTAWKNKESRTYFGFGAGATGVGKLSPHADWFAGESESGWNVHGPNPGESMVVSAIGLAYRRRRSHLNQLHRVPSPARGSTRGALKDLITISSELGLNIELEYECWGDLDAITDEDEDFEEEEEKEKSEEEEKF